MPYVKLSAARTADKTISAAIRYGMSMCGCNYTQLAKTIHIDRVTIYRRLKDPESFTLRELRGIAEKLHTTVEKLINGETN